MAAAPQTIGGPYAATREFFLRGLSACYFAAFASFLLQVPGLYGAHGLVPAEDPAGMDRQCLQGLLLAALGLSGWGNLPVMLGMLKLYHDLVEQAPPPFYNFQWDILLLEVGCLAALLAPAVHSCLEPRPSGAVLWMLRLVLFKLMLMSGIVKLTEGDASWKDLTAVWYHFATQCIPTPAAWFFHNLPLPLEKLFCAACFAIEIPATLLILVPIQSVQVFAAVLQIALQIIIIVTGNYTFFNYLTIFVACALLPGDAIPWPLRPAGPRWAAAVARELWAAPKAAGAEPGGGAAGAADSGADAVPLLDRPGAAGAAAEAAGGRSAGPASVEGALVGRLLDFVAIPQAAKDRAAWSAPWLLLLLSALLLWRASVPLGVNWELRMYATPQDVLDWADLWVPRALILLSVVVPLVTLLDVANVLAMDAGLMAVHPADLAGGAASQRRAQEQAAPAVVCLRLTVMAAASTLLVMRCTGCMQLLGAMPGPLSEIAPSLQDPATRVSAWGLGRPARPPELPLGVPAYGPYGYGLFRAMTGIGPGGVVARPELTLEARGAASGTWRELQFRYKPGDVSRRPPLVAPYQPRLDWQTWFQALSRYPQPWFGRLVQCIGEGSPEVLSLLDPSSFPAEAVNALRVRAFTYNFTAYGQTGWWQREAALAKTPLGFQDELVLENQLDLRAQAAQHSGWQVPAVWAFLGLAALLWALPHIWQEDMARWWAQVRHPDRKDC